MAMLLLHVGEIRFAVACKDVVQVIPNVLLFDLLSQSPIFTGLMAWRGKSVPVIDFCQLIEKRSAKQCLHTRIILLEWHQKGEEKLIGLLAEKIHHMIELSPENFTTQEFPIPDYSFISKGFLDDGGMIFYLDIEEFSHFISEEIFHEPFA